MMVEAARGATGRSVELSCSRAVDLRYAKQPTGLRLTEGQSMKRMYRRVFGSLLMTSLGCAAHAADATPPQRIPDSYAHAGSLVEVAPGRKLNLRCEGDGVPTVLLETGSHADTTTWFRLQPLIATHYRVCSYDRAGYGFSDGGPLPRDLAADVADLHALIHKAGLKTPLVLVGHSLGTNIVRSYATHYADDVSGLVLIDPPAQDVAAFAPAWAKEEDAMGEQRFAFLDQCKAAAEKGQLASPAPALKNCVAGNNPMASAAVNASIAAYKLKPAFWQTLSSELRNNVKVFAQPVAAGESLGTLPLIVLSASGTYGDAPADVRPSLEKAKDKTQDAIAALSTHGKRITINDASHDIQLDQPEAVAKAVTEVVKQASAGHH